PNLVVGNLWPFLEGVPDRIERLRSGEADEFINLRLEPGGRVGRRNWDRQDYALGATAAHRLDAGLGRVPSGNAVVSQDHGSVLERRHRSRAQCRQPGPQLLALPCRRVPDVVLGQAEVLAQPSIEDQYGIIIDRPDGELRIAGSAELAHRADPQWQMQVDGDRLRHNDAAAWDPQHDGSVVVAIALQRGSEALAGIHPVVENHRT